MADKSAMGAIITSLPLPRRGCGPYVLFISIIKGKEGCFMSVIEERKKDIYE
jgi:hypothetical protein